MWLLRLIKSAGGIASAYRRHLLVDNFTLSFPPLPEKVRLGFPLTLPPAYYPLIIFVDSTYTYLEGGAFSGGRREARAGFEPANRGFADLSLSHLGTAPWRNIETSLSDTS